MAIWNVESRGKDESGKKRKIEVADGTVSDAQVPKADEIPAPAMGEMAEKTHQYAVTLTHGNSERDVKEGILQSGWLESGNLAC